MLTAAQRQLQFYVGRWSCEAIEYDAGKPHPMKMAVKVEPVFDGAWLAVNVFVDGEQVGSELKGFDSEHKFHNLWTSPDGAWGSLVGAGWEGSRIVADEEHPTAGSRMRTTFTKIDETHYTHHADVDEGSGYKPVFEKSCHKMG